MKKLFSLIRACMTKDMRLFKIKTKNNNKLSNILIPSFIALYLMFMIWGSANTLFEKVAPTHIQYIFLSLFVFAISLMTIIEGIYKTGSLLFNCKDDQLLLSLPIKRRTVLFVRMFKFYVFELMYNSMFLLPIMIAYIRWGENLNWTYYLTNIVMLLLLPIIPIVISCFIGLITSSISSRFKYKNATQIILSMILILGIFYISFNMDSFFDYVAKHATNINDIIVKIYYPAGIYAKLVVDFNILDLLIFILINIVVFIISIYIISKFYFKINSRLKQVTTTKKVKLNKLTIKSNKPTVSLIKKEINTFFKTPVFIINAGFGLMLFLIATISLTIKYDTIFKFLTDAEEGMGLSQKMITSKVSLLILLLVIFTAFMTSITNSVISLEGRKINILKSLPLKAKTILMSKVYSGLVLTTPVLFLGDIILFIKFKIKIIEALMILVLSVIIPLVSHFIGIIVNLKYPKLNAESSTEVVKQSASSFISVMLGMILLMINFIAILKVEKYVSSFLIILICTIVYIVIDLILYIYLAKKSVKDFNALSI